MVDLSKFDDDKLDPTFPTELDAQIISLLFDLPDLAEQVLPHLKPTYFQGLEAQVVSAEILNHHAKHGQQPTRPIEPACRPPVGRADGLAGVFDDRDAGRARDGHDGIHVGAPAIQVDRDDGARARGDRRGERGGIEGVRGRIDVDERRRGAEARDAAGRRDEPRVRDRPGPAHTSGVAEPAEGGPTRSSSSHPLFLGG